MKTTSTLLLLAGGAAVALATPLTVIELEPLPLDSLSLPDMFQSHGSNVIEIEISRGDSINGGVDSTTDMWDRMKTFLESKMDHSESIPSIQTSSAIETDFDEVRERIKQAFAKVQKAVHEIRIEQSNGASSDVLLDFSADPDTQMVRELFKNGSVAALHLLTLQRRHT